MFGCSIKAGIVLSSHAQRLTLPVCRNNRYLRTSQCFQTTRSLNASLNSEPWKLGKVRQSCATKAASASNYPNNSRNQNENRGDSMLYVGEEARLTIYHYAAFFVVMCGGLLFVALLLYFTGDIAFQGAMKKAVKRLLKTVALRQLVTILSAIFFINYGLEPAIKAVRAATKAQGPWEKSGEYYILKEVCLCVCAHVCRQSRRAPV